MPTDGWELLVAPDFAGDVAHYSKPAEDGGLLIRSVQNAEPIIERNKALRTHDDGYNGDRTLRRVATIPAIVRIKIMQEQGWDPWKPHLHPEKMARFLNDPDYAYLRTADGRIGVVGGKIR